MMSRQRSNLAVAYLELGMKMGSGGSSRECQRGERVRGVNPMMRKEFQANDRTVTLLLHGGEEGHQIGRIQTSPGAGEREEDSQGEGRGPRAQSMARSGHLRIWGGGMPRLLRIVPAACRWLGASLVREKSGRGFEGVSGRKASCDRAANSLDPRQTPRQCNGAVTYQELRR